MPTPRTWDQNTIKQHQDVAIALYGNVSKFAPVDVKVVARTWDVKTGIGTIRVEVTHKDGSPGTYDLLWGDLKVIWPACPSTLPSHPTEHLDGAPPESGATGTLYLSGDFTSLHSIETATMPKWPRRD